MIYFVALVHYIYDIIALYNNIFNTQALNSDAKSIRLKIYKKWRVDRWTWKKYTKIMMRG